MTVLESDVERKLVRELKKLGITHVKMHAISQKGWPDRLITLDGGRAVFIELKAPGRENNLSAHQIQVIDKLMKLGFPVLVSSNVEECLEWIKSHALKV